ncbi:general transcription factor 3C polypeptide 1 [Periplaneta americana]|uniref:general transcription factor 3C polypeptide 1 n=1 Tax=Periplaneta americana TaxID=6978 RepID=UPI0037E92EDC
MYNSSHNFVSSIIDEIALEGLDGITIEGLWLRLADRPHFTCVLDDNSKSFFWNVIRQIEDVEMYELPVARSPLVIFNRYDHVDPELGMVLEPAEIPKDIYPHCAIEDGKIRGSCSTYKERKNVTNVARYLTLDEALQKWDLKLVLVATQQARNTALMGHNVNPSMELTAMQYCVLERIGRSRYLGEVTQGKVSLQLVGEDPKALFYHRKFLIRHKLIAKQVHHQKSGSQNCSGSLLHLPRFRVDRKPKALYLTEKVVEILKTRPNCIAEYEEIRKELGLANSLKKLFKTFDFQRFVRTDLRLPYRELYPEASVAEWKHKANDKEKKIRVVQLINPDMDVREIWAKDDEIEEEDDATSGLLDTSKILLDRPILNQAFSIVENSGPEGLSQMELSDKMGVSKLQARTLCRNLIKKGAVSTFMNDVGRQRVCRYISKKYIKEGKLSVEFMREKNKMLTLVGLKTEKESQSKAKKKQSAEEKKLLNKKRAHEEGPEKNSPDAKRIKSETNEIIQTTQLEVSAPVEESTVTAQTDTSEQRIETKIILEGAENSQGEKDYHVGLTEELLKMDVSNKDTPNITYRILRRANIIIEAVRTHTVIDDLTKLMKHINEEEGKEGYNSKIDKKSLLRLLAKLSKDGHIKVIKIVLKGGNKEKMLSFVCEPDITTDHSLIQSAVEQAKMKFFILGKERLVRSYEGKANEDENFSSESIHKSMDEMKAISSSKEKLKSPKFVYDSRIGKKYGFAPKFVRMQILHQFLFYVIYGYVGNENLDQEAVIRRLQLRDNSITDEVTSEMSKIYHEEVDWKMFIPPLPKHAGWPDGWAIMCDLLLRLPLCTFVKIFNVSFIIPGLEQYLLHPIRRNYLVRHLPSHLRNALTIARRYIFSIHEVMQRLCYVGLIQFGPQRLKEKDQVFIFLNRKTTLLDTTPSRPGYHQVSEDVEYAQHKYEFHRLDDIDKYWYEMWNFCIHTQLGGRMYVTGKDIVLEVLQNKQAMIDAIQPRQPGNALELDTGNVPGDKRGAAGLDSAFFSHLKRNWNWTNTSKTLTSIADENVSSIKPRVEEQRKARLASLKTEPLQFGEIFQKPSDKPSQFRLSNVKKKIVSRKIEPKKHAVEPKRREEKKKKVVRHVLPRQKKKRVHRPYYDEVDMEALKLMSKLRVEWSITEDNLLLLCKVAVMYLCPFPRKQIINFQTIRDVLHKICPSSHNKTSRACQRRILYMMKNKSTAHSVALHLEEVRQDPEIIKQFNNTIQELKSKTDDIEEMEKLAAEKFKVLVSVLQRKFNPHPSDYKQTGNCIPVSLAEFKKQYELVYPSPTLKKRGRFQDVKNVVDIYCAIVNTIIHSSLCCATDKTSYTYQLFQVYQQYPDNLLRSAMAKIRSDQMVSLKKSYMRLKPKTGNYLPVSSSPYQLSISYVYQLQTKYQYDIFYESHLMTKKLRSWYMEHAADLEPALGLEVGVSDGGTAAALVELFTKKQMSFDIEIPEQVIILDPRVSEKDETYARIVQRYRDILRTYKSGKELVSSSIIFKKPFWDEKEKGKEVGEPSCSKDVDIDPDDVDGDDFDFDGIEETDEPQTSANQQNAIARVASRIALYMMREELGDSVLGEKQHAHDFFVVNSCKVFCKFHNPHRDNTEGHIIDDIGQITPVSVVSEVAGGTSHIKSTSNVSETLTDIAGKVSEECVNKEMSSQKQDHVNSQSQEDMPSEAMEVDQEVQEKLKTTIPVCAGDSEEKSVKYGSESDVNTQHQDSESVYGSPSASTSQNKDQNKPEDFLSGVPADLVPITQKEVKKILDDIGKNLVVSEDHVTAEEVKEKFFSSGTSEADWKKAEDILAFVQKKKEIGATMQELRKNFRKQKSPMSLAEILALLSKSHILYRSGVTTVHYIYHMFMKPWLVHSYKLLRLEREKQVLPPHDAVMKVAGPDNQSEKTHERIRAWRRRKLITTAQEVEKAVQTLDLSASEKIHVAIRPWVRVDGTLNRRVLDRMLGAVLGHSMYMPGSSIKDITDYFMPALQPFQTRELIEILDKLGCVTLSVEKVSWKTTLFSKPSSVKLTPADGTEDEAKIIVDPQPDAVLRLGQFIGDKAYFRDFLSTRSNYKCEQE